MFPKHRRQAWLRQRSHGTLHVSKAPAPGTATSAQPCHPAGFARLVYRHGRPNSPIFSRRRARRVAGGAFPGVRQCTRQIKGQESKSKMVEVIAACRHSPILIFALCNLIALRWRLLLWDGPSLDAKGRGSAGAATGPHVHGAPQREPECKEISWPRFVPSGRITAHRSNGGRAVSRCERGQADGVTSEMTGGTGFGTALRAVRR